MRTLVHLSDLHFGRTDPSLIEPLVAAVTRLQPDVVAISGDLTQRARTWQFTEAQRFLRRLPTPQVVVPGNHDVPLYDVVARFLRPLAKYRRYISPNLMPVYIDAEIAVLGLNTARSLTTKYGRINRAQLAAIVARMRQLDRSIVKVLVTHHPFDLPAGCDEQQLVGRAPLAMEVLARCGIDLLLAGHLHLSHAGDTAARYPIPNYSALVVQSGTALSTRARGEENSFSAIRIDGGEAVIERHAWSGDRLDYLTTASQRFTRNAGIWQRRSA